MSHSDTVELAVEPFPGRAGFSAFVLDRGQWKPIVGLRRPLSYPKQALIAGSKRTAAKMFVTDADRCAENSHSIAMGNVHGDRGYKPNCVPPTPITIDNTYAAKQAPIIRGQILAGAKALAGRRPASHQSVQPASQSWPIP